MVSWLRLWATPSNRKEARPQFVFMIAIISIMVSLVVAVVTLDWFFRDGEDSTRSLEEYTQKSWIPGWNNRFGIWMAVSGGAGMLCYRYLPAAIACVRAHL